MFGGPRDKEHPVLNELAPLCTLKGVARGSIVSKDGQRCASWDTEGAVVVEIGSRRELCRVSHAGIEAADLSPAGTYLTVWSNKKDGGPNNVVVFETSSGEVATSFTHKAQPETSWPPLSFSEDEKIAARPVADGVLVYEDVRAEPVASLELNSVRRVLVAPGSAPYHFAVFSRATRSRPGSVSLFRHPATDRSEMIAARSAFQADDAVLKWSPNGRGLLVELTTETARDSYQGESRLFYLSVKGDAAIVPVPKEGAVHDSAWSPTSDKFVVVAGKSPPAAALYNLKTEKIFSFGSAAHNTARFDPHGRFLVLAGFGNMAGRMVFWDLERQCVLGEAEAAGTHVAEWSPCGRWFLTATISPRLRVDNGVSLWRYNGEGPHARQDFKELLGCSWVPMPTASFPSRPPSPGRDRARPAPKKSVYRPPSQRSTSGPSVTDLMAAERSGKRIERSNVGRGRPIGAAPPKRLPVGAAPPAGGKKKAKGAAPPPEVSILERDLSALSIDEKNKIRNKIKQKLRDIAKIKEKIEAGESVNDAQRAKIDSEAQYQAKLKELE